mmetsp:Transcript_32476/g.76261  ORF Transcript_32476/g.76261 Transcript_32476/m.76261 type:complete len:271 (+) Transcript_32476:153-965(+)
MVHSRRSLRLTQNPSIPWMSCPPSRPPPRSRSPGSVSLSSSFSGWFLPWTTFLWVANPPKASWLVSPHAVPATGVSLLACSRSSSSLPCMPCGPSIGTLNSTTTPPKRMGRSTGPRQPCSVSSFCLCSSEPLLVWLALEEGSFCHPCFSKWGWVRRPRVPPRPSSSLCRHALTFCTTSSFATLTHSSHTSFGSSVSGSRQLSLGAMLQRGLHRNRDPRLLSLHWVLRCYCALCLPPSRESNLLLVMPKVVASGGPSILLSCVVDAMKAVS